MSLEVTNWCVDESDGEIVLIGLSATQTDMSNGKWKPTVTQKPVNFGKPPLSFF